MVEPLNRKTGEFMSSSAAVALTIEQETARSTLTLQLFNSSAVQLFNDLTKHHALRL